MFQFKRQRGEITSGGITLVWAGKWGDEEVTNKISFIMNFNNVCKLGFTSQTVLCSALVSRVLVECMAGRGVLKVFKARHSQVIHR